MTLADRAAATFSSLPPEFTQLKEELAYGIASLFAALGLEDATQEDRAETLANLADTVFLKAIGALAEAHPKEAEAFFEEATRAMVAGDEAAFLQALSTHFPDFPEVFAHTAFAVVQDAARLVAGHIAQTITQAAEGTLPEEMARLSREEVQELLASTEEEGARESGA